MSQSHLPQSQYQKLNYHHQQQQHQQQQQQPQLQKATLNSNKSSGFIFNNVKYDGGGGSGIVVRDNVPIGFSNPNYNKNNIRDKITINNSCNNKNDIDIVGEMNKMYKKSPFAQRKINELSGNGIEYGSSPKKESTLASIG